jgi:hypothetical protein
LLNTDSHTDFAVAGKDGMALVTSRVLQYRRDANSRTANLQITAFPRPSSVIYLADAAAIKVRLL